MSAKTEVGKEITSQVLSESVDTRVGSHPDVLRGRIAARAWGKPAYADGGTTTQ